MLFAAAVFGVAAAQDLKVIVDATLFDGTGREPLRDAVIVIEGSRSREVGTRSRVTIAEDAHRIEATGKFVIPGLSDMHAYNPIGVVHGGYAVGLGWKSAPLHRISNTTEGLEACGGAQHPQDATGA